MENMSLSEVKFLCFGEPHTVYVLILETFLQRHTYTITHIHSGTQWDTGGPVKQWDTGGASEAMGQGCGVVGHSGVVGPSGAVEQRTQGEQ
jgi:hypothetical protein